jgi:deoxyribonuclease-4
MAYGVFIESLLRCAYESKTPQNYENNIALIYRGTFSTHSPTQDIPFDLSDKITRSYMFKIYHFAKTLVSYGTLLFQQELQVGNITGHPDIISEGAYLDVKTTSKWDSMKTSSILQMLCYAALGAEMGNRKPFIGIILPCQQQILMHDVSDWDHRPFLLALQSAANAIDIKQLDACWYQHRDSVGTHVGTDGCKASLSRGAKILSVLKKHDPSIPLQMFLSAPRACKPSKISDAELKELNQTIKDRKIKYYTHAPYCINLAADNDWAMPLLIHELKQTAAMGGKGVVVHMGTDENMERGLAIFARNVYRLLKHATKECPLLLETSCGEGNEFLSEIDDLVWFVKLFKGDERLAVCVDTCHVFAAGYEPSGFIETLVENKIVVKLIHFNDSERCQGSKVDRHAFIGRGQISRYSLQKVMKLAIDNKADLVIE